MPTISVIIPAYNAEKTILETIESVQQQTFSDFELIVINDGSTDGTLELLHSVIDERLKIFSYDNGGLCVARNRGLRQATGNFIAFLDADDLWTSDKLELQLAALQQHPEAGVAYSWTSYIDEQGKTLFVDKPIFFKGNVYAQLLVNNFLASGSNPLIWRTAIESVGEFDPAIPPCADWDFYLRLSTKWSFFVVPKHQILYRQASGTMSSKIDAMEEKLFIMVEKFFREAPPKFQSLKGQSWARIYQYCAEKHLQNITNNYKNTSMIAVDIMKGEMLTKIENKFSEDLIEPRHFKNQILAAIYQYCSEKYLLYSANKVSEVNQAGQHLWMAICLYPQGFFKKYPQNLIKWFIKKWIIVRFIPNRFTNVKLDINKTQ
jgi:glycosyltransferase involved in cell wall biosynthesis